MEELLAIIRATITDPALAKQLTDQLTAKKLTVRSETEETQYKDNLLNQERPRIEAEERRKLKGSIEQDFRELVPDVIQQAGEEYHKYYKRAVQKMKDKIAELEAAGAGTDVVPKGKYDKLEADSKKALADKDAELARLKQATERQERLNILNQALTPIEQTFMTELPSYFQDYKKVVVEETLAKSAVIDGVLVLVDDQGNPLKDSNLNNIPVENHFKTKFKDVIKVHDAKPGAGTKPAAGPPPGGSGGGGSMNIPATVDTQGKLTEHLMKAGLAQGTKEFDEAFSKAVTEKNITKIF
jgi:hypothetical protein